MNHVELIQNLQAALRDALSYVPNRTMPTAHRDYYTSLIETVNDATEPTTVYITEYHNGGAPDDCVHFIVSTATDELQAITNATVWFVNNKHAPGYDGYRDSFYLTVTGWQGNKQVSTLTIGQ